MNTQTESNELDNGKEPAPKRLLLGILGVLLVPVWAPLLLAYIAVIASLLLFIAVLWLFVWRPRRLAADRRHRARLAAFGRVMNVRDLEAAIATGGTILLEQELGCDGSARVWWTTDRIEPDAASAPDTNEDWLARQATLWSVCKPYVQEGARGATLIRPEPLLEQRARRAAEGLDNVKVIEFYSGEGMDEEIRWGGRHRHNAGTRE